jgi:branched-chain amino acid transport system permease protein
MTARAPRLLLLAALVALVLFPAIGDKYYLQLLAKVMLMAVFAMSLDLLVGFTGLVSLGHAAFFGLGGYALWLLSPQYAAGSLWLTAAGAVAIAALAALLIGFLVLRSSGVYFIMVTLAFTQMFFYYATGAKWLGGSDGAYIYVRPSMTLFGWTPVNLANHIDFYYVALALMVATYFLLRMILRSLFGQVICGIRSNEQRLRALGFPTFRYKLASFVLAGAIAGLAGYFNAAQFGFVNPDLFGWRISGEVLMMVILGGMGTLYGPVLGAFILVLLENELAGMTRHWLLPMGLFIIVAVLALPGGVAGIFQRFARPRIAQQADA